MTPRAVRTALCRVLLVVVGTAVSCFGYLLTVGSRLGNGPLFALQDGLHRRTGVSLGTAAILVGLALVAVAAVLRAPLGPSTVAIPVLSGWCIDLLAPVTPVTEGPLAAWVAFVGGTVVMMFGAVVALGASMGAAAMDGVMLGLSRRLGCSPASTRLGMEVALAGAGAALGGQVGMGTVVMGATVGHLYTFWSARLRRWGLPMTPWPARPVAEGAPPVHEL